MFSSRNALFILASMVVSCALAYEARTVSITDTRYTDGLATSFDLAFGQGSAANAQAFFANATTTTVTIASSLLEVTDILANANDVNLTFTGGRHRPRLARAPRRRAHSDARRVAERDCVRQDHSRRDS